jgi:hypothetical protein
MSVRYVSKGNQTDVKLLACNGTHVFCNIRQRRTEHHVMKKIIVLTVVAIASHAAAIFAGEEVSSKQVIPPPPPPPPEFFRPNEFDIGAFGTYATGVGSSDAGKVHAWGGGMDFTYWFPWKYAGVRFQGTGLDFLGGGGFRTKQVTVVPGFAPVTVSGGGGDVAAGIIVGDGMLRLPLDEFWPGFHLAPYAFAGFGGILLGNSGNERSFSDTFTVTNSAGVSREVTFTGRRLTRVQQNFGSDRVLGHVGIGLEYRFTPHIGLMSEVGYVFPNGASNNLLQVNFGLRYAF